MKGGKHAADRTTWKMAWHAMQKYDRLKLRFLMIEMKMKLHDTHVCFILGNDMIFHMISK